MIPAFKTFCFRFFGFGFTYKIKIRRRRNALTPDEADMIREWFRG